MSAQKHERIYFMIIWSLVVLDLIKLRILSLQHGYKYEWWCIDFNHKLSHSRTQRITFSKGTISIIPSISETSRRDTCSSKPNIKYFFQRYYLTCENFGRIVYERRETLVLDSFQFWMRTATLKNGYSKCNILLLEVNEFESYNPTYWNLSGCGEKKRVALRDEKRDAPWKIREIL